MQSSRDAGQRWKASYSAPRPHACASARDLTHAHSSSYSNFVASAVVATRTSTCIWTASRSSTDKCYNRFCRSCLTHTCATLTSVSMASTECPSFYLRLDACSSSELPVFCEARSRFPTLTDEQTNLQVQKFLRFEPRTHARPPLSACASSSTAPRR